MTVKRYVGRKFFRLCTLISPRFNCEVVHLRIFGRRLRLKDPRSFVEKQVWLRLNNYNSNPLVRTCADKFAVREYVGSRGYGHILNDLYGVYDSVNELNWAELPGSFALKWNFGCGLNVICRNKSDLRRDLVLKKLRRWGRDRYWLTYADLFYKPQEKKLLCERYLGSEGSFLPTDYKVLCIGGNPIVVFLIADRDADMKLAYMTPDWQFVSYDPHYGVFKGQLPPPPESLDEMVEIARRLSRPFPIVRVDFYEFRNKPVFGEMTFMARAGYHAPDVDVFGTRLSEMIDIHYDGSGGAE